MSRHDQDSKRRIALSKSDLGKLKALVETAKKYLRRDYIDQLDEKLEEAEVVSPGMVPNDEVEIDKFVRITDLDRSEERVYKLVLPRDANFGNHISVIAPLGAALLGSHTGDVIEVIAPGRIRKIRVEEILNGSNKFAA